MWRVSSLCSAGINNWPVGKMRTHSLPDCWAERAVLSTLTGERKRQSWSPRTSGPGTDGGLRVQGGALGEARAWPAPDPVTGWVTGWEKHEDPSEVLCEAEQCQEWGAGTSRYVWCVGNSSRGDRWWGRAGQGTLNGQNAQPCSFFSYYPKVTFSGRLFPATQSQCHPLPIPFPHFSSP